MRKFIGLLAVVAVLLVAAAPAQAVTLPENIEVFGKLRDFSAFWDVSAGAYLPSPKLADATTLPNIGDELRTVFKITSLENRDGTEVYFQQPGTPGIGETELTGVLYDLVVGDANVVTGGAITGPTVAISGSFLIISLYPVAPDANGWGGVVDVYIEPSRTAATAYDPTAGPTAWVTGSPDTYPTVAGDAGSSIWLTGEFATLPNPVFPGAVYEISLQLNSAGTEILVDGKHTALGFLNTVVNATGRMIADDSYELDAPVVGSGRDIRVLADLTFPPGGLGTKFGSGWALASEDPIRFITYVPEPASMSLLLVGLVGGAGAYWRKRRAA